MKKTILLLALVLLGAGLARAERIKDIARIGSVRSNQLVGYGLVVGLDGSGDGSGIPMTAQALSAMLQKFGVTVPAGLIRVKNVAVVIVTCDLPAFARNGSTLDVTVSSLGDAKSLQGGTLIQTPLKAADGNVYAVAQGAVSVGGFSAGGGGSSTTKNHVTAGRVPSGALVEREVPTTLLAPGGDSNRIQIALSQPDFTTATRVATAINAAKPSGVLAWALDGGTVEVQLPEGADPVRVIAGIEGLNVASDTVGRVVVNERTGTVVIGGNVSVTPCAIAHGSLTIKIRTKFDVSQPNPLAPKGAATVVTPNTKVDATDAGGRVLPIAASTTVDQVVRALNTLGVTPRDLIAILQAMKAAGALKAELEIQ